MRERNAGCLTEVRELAGDGLQVGVRRVVDVDPHLLQIGQGHGELVDLIVVESTGPVLQLVDAGLRAHEPREE